MTKSECFKNREGLGIWDTRYAGIHMLIEAYIKEATSVDNVYGPTICDLLERLLVFGARQFSFFYKNNAREQPALQEASTHKFGVLSSSAADEYQNIEYPIPDFTLWLISNQVNNDALTLREALQQRLHPIGNAQEFLEQADKIAYSVLRTLSSVIPVYNPFGEQVQFISYFRRGVSVRTLPYAPVALIGLPMTSRTEPRDIVSIAHEIAHFYYWYGMTSDGKPIAKILDETVIALQTQLRVELYIKTKGSISDLSLSGLLTEWDNDPISSGVPSILHWVEEIFADVISVLIAGPIAGYSIQELELIPIGNFFNEDNGSHPTPSIRPFIHVETLKQIGDKYKLDDLRKAACELETQWNCIRKPRVPFGNETEDAITIPFEEPVQVRPLPQADVEMTLQLSGLRNLPVYELKIVRDLLGRVIDAMLTLLDSLKPNWIEAQFAKTLHGEPKAWTTKINLGNPYADHNAWLADFSGEKPKMFATTETGVPDLWETLVDDLFALRDIPNANNQSMTHADLAMGPLRPEVWIELMRFPGWTIEGPTGRAH